MQEVFKFILITAIIFLSPSALSQKTVVVTFDFPENKEYEIRIDQGEVFTQKEINLTEGTHTVEIWVPGLILISDTINVSSDSKNKFIYRNKTSPQYFEYVRALKRYNSKKNLAVSAAIVSGLAISSSVLTYVKANSLRLEYDDLKLQYNTATDPMFFGSIERNLRSIERSFKTYRGLYYSSLVLAIAMPIVTVYSIKMFRKSNKPTQKYLVNPFQRTTSNLKIGFSGNGLNLTFNL